MKEKKINRDMIRDLYETILSLQTVEDCDLFFEDLCTAKEIENMAQRIATAKMLMKGCTYNEVIKATDISSATLSRVSRALQYGKGYAKFLG